MGWYISYKKIEVHLGQDLENWTGLFKRISGKAWFFILCIFNAFIATFMLYYAGVLNFSFGVICFILLFSLLVSYLDIVCIIPFLFLFLFFVAWIITNICGVLLKFHEAIIQEK